MTLPDDYTGWGDYLVDWLAAAVGVVFALLPLILNGVL